MNLMSTMKHEMFWAVTNRTPNSISIPWCKQLVSSMSSTHNILSNSTSPWPARWLVSQGLLASNEATRLSDGEQIGGKTRSRCPTHLHCPLKWKSQGQHLLSWWIINGQLTTQSRLRLLVTWNSRGPLSSARVHVYDPTLHLDRSRRQKPRDRYSVKETYFIPWER